MLSVLLAMLSILTPQNLTYLIQTGNRPKNMVKHQGWVLFIHRIIQKQNNRDVIAVSNTSKSNKYH